MKKIRWGILSTAKIGREKVIPALQAGKYCEVTAIASRNTEEAAKVASQFKIANAYGSYEELLNSNTIDAVYIPLPNHMHVAWSIKALQAGKHVLCEKPISLTAREAELLWDVSLQYPHLKVMEAFMYRFHPQWQAAKKMVDDHSIGELKTIQSFFSYYNVDPHNIRNKKETGGGGMMDIGCYCISLSRFIFNTEPEEVLGHVEYDPVLLTDRMASGILQFSAGTATFTCATQLTPYQRVNIIGTEARIEIEIPFNPSPGTQSRMWLHVKNDSKEITFPPADQYTIQGDLFSLTILNNEPSLTSLNDARKNMKVIDAVFESSKEKRWVQFG